MQPAIAGRIPTSWASKFDQHERYAQRAARVAQLVEQCPCKAKVAGSSPAPGSDAVGALRSRLHLARRGADDRFPRGRPRRRIRAAGRRDLGALRAPDHAAGLGSRTARARRAGERRPRGAPRPGARRGGHHRRLGSQSDPGGARGRQGDRYREGDRRGPRGACLRAADHALRGRDDHHPPAPGRPRARGPASRPTRPGDRRPVRDDHPRRAPPAGERHELAWPRSRGPLHAAGQPGGDAGRAARRRAARRRARPPRRGSETGRRSPSARCSAPTPSTRPATPSITSSARHSSGCWPRRTRRPTRPSFP